MNKTWKIVLAFAGVFIAGALTGGALSARFGDAPHGKDRGHVRPQLMKRIDHELHLSPEQEQRIQPLVQRAQEEVQRLRREQVKNIGAVMERLHADISAELTPEQRVRQEQWRKRFHERVERVRAEFHDHGPHGGPPPPPGERP